jgi:hypothetical protein
MRQGQQNRRGRGRSNSTSNNNGRKPQNPLSRNYESSGPDVKIRGTAAQVAEKYMALARDASASGDVITAENYLQHAEHYNRIIMAAQQAQAQSQQQPSMGGHHGHENGHATSAPQRIPAEGNGAMRDQPQPQVMPAHIPVEQPVIADGPAPAEQPQPAQAAPAAKEAEGGRRRRRRYPGNGAERASGASEAAAGNGHARGSETSGDERSSDEAAA